MENRSLNKQSNRDNIYLLSLYIHYIYIASKICKCIITVYTYIFIVKTIFF